MIGDRDQHDPNPYQSPAWPEDDKRVGGEHGSGMLTEPIRIQGSLPLDDVLRAFPGLIRRVWELALWFFPLSFLGLLVGLVVLVVYFRVVEDGLPARSALVAILPIFSFCLIPLWLSLRQFLASYWIWRLWKKQGGVFQYREVTITDERITTISAQGVATTPWTDYAGYRSNRNTVWLYLCGYGLKRRREQCRTRERQSRFGIHLDQVDVFPRLQFEDDGDWDRFQWAVKHKLRKKP